ncbi:MAG: O-antigen ligase family protein [Nitrospira sp.]|nr:O-antigen ligase family protein [Candidatus Brocadiales bacterium]MBL7050439.1 O-antigen ligase family protein [Nitrospira sp.]
MEKTESYTSYMRSVLLGFLIFVPFFNLIEMGLPAGWSKIIRYLDEVIILLLLPLAATQLLKNRSSLDQVHWIITIPFVLLIISGMVSGFVNGNPLFNTVIGLFDHVKNFIVIYLFAAFFTEQVYIKKVIRALFVIGVIIAAVAVLQEVWALFSVYILNRDMLDVDNYLWRKLPMKHNAAYFSVMWRCGLYRASGLTIHPNVMGVYSLLILTVYLSYKKKASPLAVIALIGGVFTSVSRIVYVAFVFLAGVWGVWKRKWFHVLIAVPFIIMMFCFQHEPDADVTEMPVKNQQGEYNPYSVHYRIYAKERALTVWKDHVIVGAGPGMFGGPVAKTFDSPLYEKYNFTPNRATTDTLDQFWPYSLAELGVVGTLFMAALLSCISILFILRGLKSSDIELRNLWLGLSSFIFVVFIYTMGNGLNIAGSMFTYCALAGICLGSRSKSG